MQTSLITVAIILLSKAFLPSLITGGDRSAISFEEGLWQFQVLVGLMYCGAAILFLRDMARMRAVVAASWPLWALAGIAVSSALWSVDPQMTMRRSIALLGTTMLGVYVGSSVSRDALRRGLRNAAWITVIGSAVFILGNPDLGIHHDMHDGSWRGAFLHKNTLGEFASLAVVCFMLECVARKKIEATSLAGIGVCLWLLVGAGSRTAWVMTPLLAALVIAFAGWEAKKVLKVGALVALAVAVLSPSVDWSQAVAMLERDESLTGRIPLWSLVWTDIADRPFLGYGYGAYWLNKAGVGRLFWTSLGWADSPQQAHNGFLDIWLESGLAGLFALVAAGVAFTRASASAQPIERATEWCLLALVVGFGCVGGELVVQNSMYWFLITAVFTQRCLRLPVPAKDTTRVRPLVRSVAVPSTGGHLASTGS